MNLIRFQTEMATGRFTLPVTVLLCLVLWGVSANEWTDLLNLLILSAVGYLMIETNTAFTLIRVRTSLPVCMFWTISTALFFLHPLEWGNLIALAFIAAVFQFFHSYESTTASTSVYNTFLCIGAGSLVFPPMVWYVPLLLTSMIPFRSFSTKSILAAVLGVATPYWFLLGYAFCMDRMELLLASIQETVTFHAIDYSLLPVHETVSCAFIATMHTILGCRYLQVAYMDRTRTRIYHSFLMYAGWWTMLLIGMQPCHLHVLLPVLTICSAFLGGHLFTLTRNRFSGILFVVILVCIILLCIYNLWMQ